MNRRTFIHSAGAAGLSLSGGLGLAGAGAGLSPVVRVLEDSPRERLPGELVRLIRTGLSHEDLTTALFLATTRNVQPYPDVGFKYHSVMMLRSVFLTAQHAPPAERWLPAIWAADYFKDTQAQERASSGWQMSRRAPSNNANPDGARRALTAALDKWDRDAADAAVTNYAQSADLTEIFALLFPYGARDLREIGHKAIAVCNAHGLLTLLGGAPLMPVLRSTVAALLNSEGQPDPATHDLTPDRPWRRNRERLHQIPPSWRAGRDDPGARIELRAALYRTSAEEAGGVVVKMLQRGISPDAIWQVMFDTAAELLMHEPGIVPLHAQTTANALHYIYRVCDNEQTQQMTLLQCAAFVAMFREMTRAREADLELQKLEPLPLERRPEERLEEIFSALSAGHRVQAARGSLGYLRDGGDADKLIATARHHLIYGAQEAHDYKFTAAILDNLAQFSDPGWRARFLSAGMAYFKAPRTQPVPLVAETLQLLA